ncbi:hypothetical protein CspeluHIS016_0304500 [Cutaneotrichosporon spelunceum]|uniref:Pkr1-domain-containing protein n=1 Tax=Cutaneotrichosporon spelunceum TaxID=1672016 RepID=A0AAD3TTJ0_9TREE|nr:hypothetical protein CspeluHIS016_0304500 [Cutaneotrichosporon spelunceum]
MVTTNSLSGSSASSSPVLGNAALAGEGAVPPPTGGTPGFADLLVKSIFEPGANAAVVISMNICFFLLLITLVGLAAITNWDWHVLALLFTSTILWAAMIWFIMMATAVQTNPENMPNTDMTIPAEDEDTLSTETRKDQ